MTVTYNFKDIQDIVLFFQNNAEIERAALSSLHHLTRSQKKVIEARWVTWLSAAEVLKKAIIEK